MGWLEGRFSDAGRAALLAVSVGLSFFCKLNGVPLFDVDEGAFSEATREMFVRGDFVSPYLNGEPRFDKPILVYWLQAASVWLLGIDELSFRLPSALSATLWVGAVYAFVRQFVDSRTALVSGMITATALGVSVIGKAATADALLNLLLAAAMLDLFRYYRERRRHLLYRVYFWIGLGALAKGPIAVLIPLVVSFAFFLSRGAFRAWLRAAFDPLGLLILTGVALPWYLLEYSREGDAFIAGFFLKHNLGRFSSPMQGHSGSLLYYGPVLLAMVLPYTALLLKTCARIREAWRDELNLYLWLWFLFVFVFFSLSGTKLPHYILYGCTPLFILMARYRADLRSRLWAFLPPLSFFLFLWSLPALAALLGTRVRDPELGEMLTGAGPAFGWHYPLFLGLVTLLTVAMTWDRRFPIHQKLLASGLVSVTVLNLLVLPAIGELQQAPIKQAALIARREGLRVVMWQLNAPSFSVYSGSITEKRAPRPGESVLTRCRLLPDLPPHDLLYRRAGIALARILPAGKG
jgi:4-amino-4-deoxy-L-arabinose transferase-like glycosyltransferase